jgi:hypothetical protein
MDISYSSGTRIFSTFSYLRDFYCLSGICVAGLFARWQDYAVTPVSQFFKFWTYAVFPGSDPIANDSEGSARDLVEMLSGHVTRRAEGKELRGI